MIIFILYVSAAAMTAALLFFAASYYLGGHVYGSEDLTAIPFYQ